MRSDKIIVTLLCLFIMPLVQAASFDCSKAQTEVETLICTFSQLSEADEQLGYFYNQALKSLPTIPAAQLREEQRAWLEKRDQHLTTLCMDQNCLAHKQSLNACFNADCAVQFYAERIAMLEGERGKSETANRSFLAASFDCAKASTHVENMICANPQLSDLDGRLGQLYTELKDSLTKVDKEALQKEQGAWLKKRDKQITQCAGDIECAITIYADRLNMLQETIPHHTDHSSSGNLLAASFDCTKASTHVEKMICANPQLRDLDGQLGAIYQQLKETLAESEIKTLQQEQSAWLKARDTQLTNCGKDVDCAIAVYTNRITQLDTQLNGDLYNHADTSPIIGRYGIGGYMSLQVKPLVKDHVLIEIEGAEPTSARWLCGFSGVGTLMENTVKICHTEQNTPILFTFSEQGVAVTGDNLDYFCGNGGTLVGQYTKLDH